MDAIIAAQGWLYSSMAKGLGDVSAGDATAMALAMGAAILFGALHALMPGHGKTVLVSYHLGQPARLTEGFANGAILILTHVGLALILVLAGFAVISKAFAYGGRTPQFEMASGALVALLGAYLLWRTARHDHNTAPRNGKTLAFVTGLIPCPLTTFIMTCALARGMLGAGLAVTAAMTLGMIATIAGITLLAIFARPWLLALLERSEGLRRRGGMILEIGGAVLVLGFGLWMIASAMRF